MEHNACRLTKLGLEMEFEKAFSNLYKLPSDGRTAEDLEFQLKSEMSSKVLLPIHISGT